MSKKIKLFKSSYVSEDGHIVNPEAGRMSFKDNLQKSKAPEKEPIKEPEPKGKPIEDFHPESIADTLTAMHETAIMSAGRAKGDMVKVDVSPIKKIESLGIRFFDIKHDN